MTIVPFALIFVLLGIFQISTSSPTVRTNSDELRICLSSSLSSSTRTIYPCDTLANQNSQCDHFNVSRLSNVNGGRISHAPAVVVYAMNSTDVQNVVKCATKLDYTLWEQHI